MCQSQRGAGTWGGIELALEFGVRERCTGGKGSGGDDNGPSWPTASLASWKSLTPGPDPRGVGIEHVALLDWRAREWR